MDWAVFGEMNLAHSLCRAGLSLRFHNPIVTLMEHSGCGRTLLGTRAQVSEQRLGFVLASRPWFPVSAGLKRRSLRTMPGAPDPLTTWNPWGGCIARVYER